MTSKKLESILGSVPSATAKGEQTYQYQNNHNSEKKNLVYTRIVATIPQTLKDEIKKYIQNNKGETETTIILKSLKKMGFEVDPSWIVDKRTLR